MKNFHLRHSAHFPSLGFAQEILENREWLWLPWGQAVISAQRSPGETRTDGAHFAPGLDKRINVRVLRQAPRAHLRSLSSAPPPPASLLQDGSAPRGARSPGRAGPLPRRCARVSWKTCVRGARQPIGGRGAHSNPERLRRREPREEAGSLLGGDCGLGAARRCGRGWGGWTARESGRAEGPRGRVRGSPSGAGRGSPGRAGGGIGPRPPRRGLLGGRLRGAGPPGGGVASQNPLRGLGTPSLQCPGAHPRPSSDPELSCSL